MTELPGGPYLLSLSLVALTVAVVSALVMLVRQTMGGKLSNFDVYLMVTYVSLGFAIAFDAILPSLVSLYEPSAVVLWAVGAAKSTGKPRAPRKPAHTSDFSRWRSRTGVDAALA